MLTIALSLLLLVAQADDGPVSTNQVVPPPSAAALEAAKAKAEAEKKKRAEDAAKITWDWGPTAAPAPAPGAEPTFDEALAASYGDKPSTAAQTEEERRAAANRAALERAEQAGREATAPPGKWPDEGKMRCKQTDTGFVCGNSDKALEPDSPSRKALDELLKPN